ncbi:DUF4255 domain-containing protein [Myxococcota bacterium]|nr:DUF4255 domain-containing protein [Myxococcota bacterium]
MTQHRILRQTSESLSTALEDGVRALLGRTIQVVTGPPLREKFTRLPALGLYLYRVAVLTERRELVPTLVSRIDATGDIREFYQDPPVPLGLDYLVSAWADEDAEQQELLGAAMRALLGTPVLEGSLLEGDAFDPDERISVRPVEDVSVEFLMSLWRGFGEQLRPSVAYRCRLMLNSPRRSADLQRVATKSIRIDQ